MEVPAEVRSGCPRPEVPSGELGKADLQVFTVQQEAAIGTCEARKDQGVGIIDGFNEALTQMAADLKQAEAAGKKGWKLW